MIELGNNLREQSFDLKLKVIKVEDSIVDTNAKGHKFQQDTQSIILMPSDMSDNAFTRFLIAYEESVKYKRVDQSIEVIGLISGHIIAPCRFELHQCKAYKGRSYTWHLFVMTMSVEEKLKNYINLMIDLSIVPTSQEELYQV